MCRFSVWKEVFKSFGEIPRSTVPGSYGKSIWFCEELLDCLPKWLCMDSPGRKNSAPPPEPEVNSPCSISEGTEGKLLAMIQCTRVLEILETCYLKHTQHRGAQSSSVSFHPGAILLMEKESPELWLWAVGEAPRIWFIWAEPGLTGHRLPGLPLGQTSGFIYL